ncbi:MAG: UDP-N-acetylmuramoyl-tripeptide--D-alanyl-D-alanine ligase [Flavobacteriia bacterium]
MKDLFELFYQTTGVSTDTRKIAKDSLFICLKGSNFNGNTFAEQALLNGAKYVIVDEETYKTSEKIFLVEDCLEYLQKLANYHRNRFNIPVIGITGSNGKTSTKELINIVLSSHYRVLSTIGNLNNHIGVPLTLLRLSDEHQIAIIEMGANRFKDIEELCLIAEPTHGIITNIGKAHLEGFGNFEGVLKTKKELYDAVALSNGTVIYNIDDEILKSNLPDNVRHISYGTSENADVTGELIGLNPFVELKWNHDDYQSPVLQTQMIGKYNFYNYLAAITFGICFDVPVNKINLAISSYSPENNRSQVKKTVVNTLILDCYNANPTSMRSALESFAMIDHPSKLFLIGDMLELGNESEKEHQNIAELIIELGIKGFSIGPIFKKIHSTAFQAQYENKDEAIDALMKTPIKGALVLLKGSRGIGLETLEEYL